MRINTGNNFVPLITVLGIWSVSALTALPGLAISPIMGDLQTIFPKASQMQIQMLTSLPSLLILPLILLSGYLSQKISFYKLLLCGLFSFGIAGILYFLCTKMWQLVAVSAFLGIGAGLIIPLSTGLISIFFSGEVRTKQFGYSSAISNLTVVLATFLTGYLATINWKLPFLVYLLPFVSIGLVLPLKMYWPKDENSLNHQQTNFPPDNLSLKIDPNKNYINKKISIINIGKYGIDIKNLIRLMLFYGGMTFIVVTIIFYLPFLVKSYGMSETDSGNMISLFFLAMMLPGLILNRLIKLFKNYIIIYPLILIILGFIIIIFSHYNYLITLGVIAVGMGYGIIQPICYNKTVNIALKKKETIALAYLMIMNYFSILICPIIMDWIKSLFKRTDILPLQLSTCLSIIILGIVIFNSKKYTFCAIK